MSKSFTDRVTRKSQFGEKKNPQMLYDRAAAFLVESGLNFLVVLPLVLACACALNRLASKIASPARAALGGRVPSGGAISGSGKTE